MDCLDCNIFNMKTEQQSGIDFAQQTSETIGLSQKPSGRRMLVYKVLLGLAIAAIVLLTGYIIKKSFGKDDANRLRLVQDSKVSVVFFTCCSQHSTLEEALRSFLALNEYPIRKLIVVNDGPRTAQLDYIVKKFADITMLSTGLKVGQLRAIDEALKLVSSPYVYYSGDDFKVVQRGLITNNIELLEKTPKLLHLLNAPITGPRYLNGTKTVDPVWPGGGFSLLPSVWRMSDYRLLKGGFANVTNDESRGKEAGLAVVKIGSAFRAQGFYVKKSETNYLAYFGATNKNLNNAATQNSSISENTSNQTKLHAFQLTEQSNITIVFLTCCHRHDMLQEAIVSFLEFNEYPFKKLIVVNDGPSNRQIDEIAEMFPNMTMLSTGDKGGQIRSVDESLKLVDTPYVYYSQDDIKITRTGLISMDVQLLEKDPKLLQVWNTPHANGYEDGTDIVMLDWIWGGFSFQPSVWRMSDYYAIEGGFTNLTSDRSRGKGAGVEEITIVLEFQKRGYYVRESAISYHKHLGDNRSNPKRVLNNGGRPRRLLI